MKKENYFKLLNALGVLFLLLFVIVMTLEIRNFSPYNTGVPFFIDKIVLLLLPCISCFILANVCKRKYNHIVK